MTLKEWRTKKKWSQVHLANVLSKITKQTVSQQNIHMWESNSAPIGNMVLAIDKLTAGAVVWPK